MTQGFDFGRMAGNLQPPNSDRIFERGGTRYPPRYPPSVARGFRKENTQFEFAKVVRGYRGRYPVPPSVARGFRKKNTRFEFAKVVRGYRGGYPVPPLSSKGFSKREHTI